MNEGLTRIVSDLFAKANRGEDLSAQIVNLRLEIKKGIESEDSLFGKLHGLVDSFREIIPDEMQRYNAAIKALSTTSKLTPQEIVASVNNQLNELTILEKVLMPSIPGLSNELKAMEVKLQQTQSELVKLRGILVQLENEEKAIISALATRGQAATLVEKGMREAFASIAAEITDIKNKVALATTEKAAQPLQQQPAQQQPVQQQPVQLQQPVQQQPVQQQPEYTEFQKKCPMCGGRMDLQIETWICYSCAHEESKQEQGQGKTREESGGTSTLSPIPQTGPVKSDIPSPHRTGNEPSSQPTATPASQESQWQKKCPMCGGQMHFQISEQTMLCYTCAYEEKRDGAQSKHGEHSQQERSPDPEAAPSCAVPLADLPSHEYQETKKSSLATKKKPCPVCKKKMSWYPEEKAWRCPSCHYERRI